MHRRTLGGIVFAAVIVGVIAAWLFTPLGDWLTIDKLKESRAWLADLVAARPLLCASAFFLFCVVATAACFPAAPVLGVSGGALFGLWAGLPLFLAAWAIGSTIAFFISRYLLRDWVERRFGRRIAAIDRGMEAHGALYLLTVRFNPVIPYWLVNLAMGLTAMAPRTYVGLTVVGLAPAASIYVNAGTQLMKIERPSDIVSTNLVIALLLLSLFPLIVRVAGPLLKRVRGH